jgi:hypothetical protein
VPTNLPVSACALSRDAQTNFFQIAVSASGRTAFRIEHSEALTNAAWASLGPYSVTGAVTTVVDTNTAPARFYRAVSP